MESFKGKRILVMCKETYSFPLFFLLQRWKDSNEVAAFFFNPSESMYAKSTLNENTYYAYKERLGIKLYDSEKILYDFINKDIQIDYEELEKIEREYSQFGIINLQIISSQFLTRHYHYRNYMAACSYEEQLKWIWLNYKNIENIISDFQPDVVIDDDGAELARIVMREICHKMKIPYITLDHPRYEFYKTYTYNLNHSVDSYFIDKYNEVYKRDISELGEEILYVKDFKDKSAIMHQMYNNDVTSQYRPTPILTTLKSLVGKFNYFLKQDFTGNNRKLKKSCPMLFPDSWEYIKFYFRYEFSKRTLLRKNKFFRKPEKVNYVYMPLHLIPESTTFTSAPYYINELNIIEAVSKSLPVGWWLYVKEHQAMVGERGVDFYKKVNALPNVKMVQINYYNDPKPWISNARGVVTISGTSAYEAALLGKHAIIFSDVPFKLIDGIYRCRSYEDLPLLLKRFTTPLDNIKSCASYIKTVKEVGYSVNMKLLLAKGESFISSRTEPDKEYMKELNSLEKLYYKAYLEYGKA